MSDPYPSSRRHIRPIVTSACIVQAACGAGVSDFAAAAAGQAAKAGSQRRRQAHCLRAIPSLTRDSSPPEATHRGMTAEHTDP